MIYKIDLKVSFEPPPGIIHSYLLNHIIGNTPESHFRDHIVEDVRKAMTAKVHQSMFRVNIVRHEYLVSTSLID